MANSHLNSITYGDQNSSGAALMGMGVIGTLGIWVWSISDAVKLAKTKNLSWRENNKVSMTISPNKLTINF